MGHCCKSMETYKETLGLMRLEVSDYTQDYAVADADFVLVSAYRISVEVPMTRFCPWCGVKQVKLLPCPQCKSTNVAVGTGKFVSVMCKDCELEGDSYCQDAESAIEFWNSAYFQGIKDTKWRRGGTTSD